MRHSFWTYSQDFKIKQTKFTTSSILFLRLATSISPQSRETVPLMYLSFLPFLWNHHHYFLFCFSARFFTHIATLSSPCTLSSPPSILSLYSVHSQIFSHAPHGAISQNIWTSICSTAAFWKEGSLWRIFCYSYQHSCCECNPCIPSPICHPLSYLISCTKVKIEQPANASTIVLCHC